MKDKKITYIIGNNKIQTSVMSPYSDLVCDFLHDLSSALLRDRDASLFPDVVSLGFFCRRANIVKKKNSFFDGRIRLGRGVAFHITPSNVPVNFAFSYIFGLLSGNANIVRIPNKEFPQISIICKALNSILGNEKYDTIRETTMFVKYDRNSEITSYFSSKASVRIIWGGDKTVMDIRKIPILPRGVDVSFVDRYSFSLMNADKIIAVEQDELKQLADKFYNDTYLMDQNACSSPSLIVWQGRNKEAAKSKFWQAVRLSAEKYNLQPVSAVDKYTKLCVEAIRLDNVCSFQHYGNLVYVVDLKEISSSMDCLRGSCGYFYQYDCDDLSEIKNIVNDKYQTLTYYGFEKNYLVKFVTDNKLAGIDRIVPVGQALDIDVIWDGYDLISSLSRIIDIR